MMLVHDALELVQRFHENSEMMLDKDTCKDRFISYVFTEYQQEVLQQYDLDMFYEHLDRIQLGKCRIDFDLAVDRWYQRQYELFCEEGTFHDRLFTIVKEVLLKQGATTKEHLINSLTKFFTAPTGFMQRWMNDTKRSVGSYFYYVSKMGIRTYNDIEALVDVWAIENPEAFKEDQQELLAKRKGRGRPQNRELSLLIKHAQEIKPQLTPQEKERIRKIYYYYRKSLDMLGMIEKFRSYLLAKAKEAQNKKFTSPKQPNSIQVV
ncbi:hypothetical protein EDM56_23180 [Brevibacillus fluminis]|uniref:Uncharacterized protein n=1 Tax=Brevibacillus fluminis TaxID=511487 RepID=A0A3M8D3Z9_9BACL|nr:hypothetical protein [Brevibacillus fluminis]RNB82804.1 hypothetical protein EDM56_23180 [Brevibacillus fluminis]